MYDRQVKPISHTKTAVVAKSLPASRLGHLQTQAALSKVDDLTAVSRILKTQYRQQASNKQAKNQSKQEINQGEPANTNLQQAELPEKPPAKSKKSVKKPQYYTILAEGSCDFLLRNSSYSRKCGTVLFTCDKTCENAKKKGCQDSDNWMAIPKSLFKWGACGNIYTIYAANGQSTTGYVRDRSEKEKYEVSNGILKNLGLPANASFKGYVQPQ